MNLVSQYTTTATTTVTPPSNASTSSTVSPSSTGASSAFSSHSTSGAYHIPFSSSSSTSKAKRRRLSFLSPHSALTAQQAATSGLGLSPVAGSPFAVGSLASSLGRSFGGTSWSKNGFLDFYNFSFGSKVLNTLSASPSSQDLTAFSRLEDRFFQNFSCCGLDLKDLHALLQHFEEAHAHQNGSGSGRCRTMSIEEEDGDEEFLVYATATSSADSMAAAVAAAFPHGEWETWEQETDDDDESPFFDDDDDIEDIHMFELESGSVHGYDENDFPFGNEVFESLQSSTSSLTFTDIYFRAPLTPEPQQKQSRLSKSSLGGGGGGAHNRSNSASSIKTVTSSTTPTLPSPRKHTKTSSVSLSEIYCKRDTNGMDVDMMNGIGTQVLVPDLQMSSPLTPNRGKNGKNSPATPSKTRASKTIPTPNTTPRLSSTTLPAALGVDEEKDDRPYKCHVPGCIKAYKNPGGLKYHLQHGHCEESGGPEMNQMSQKPFKCSIPNCGRRYKNVNGLKVGILRHPTPGF